MQILRTNNMVQCSRVFEFIGVSEDAYLSLGAWVWHHLYQPHSVSSQASSNQVLQLSLTVTSVIREQDFD